MIGPVLLIGALCYIAYKLGQAGERMKNAPGPHELADDLRRAAATREWRA